VALADLLPPVALTPAARVPRGPTLRGPLPLRLALLVPLVLLAAPLTVRSAWTDWHYQSPVAELAFVPVLAVLMAVATMLRHPFLRTLRMGRADVWVAATLLSVVAVTEGWALVQPGSYLWVLRFDALTLPLVATAVVTLLFGVRALVVMWPALTYMTLSWPLPTAAAVELLTGPVTRLTSLVVQALLAPLGWAATAVRQDADLVVRVHGMRGDVDVAVTSACSGLSGMLGFAVVGIAALYLFEGRFRGRVGWLTTGLGLVLAVNVVRILGLVAAAATLGPAVALDVLHPVVGLVLLNVDVGVMLLLAPRFGLTRRGISPVISDNPLHAVGEPQPARARRVLHRAVVLALVTALLGLVNLQMAQAAPAYRNSGLARIQSLSGVLRDATSVGYFTRSVDEQRWARRYFGSDSRWRRFVLESSDPEVPNVWADVLDTNSLSSLRTHSTKSCYRFHQQDVEAQRTVELTNGVLVETYVVHMGRGTWHVVTWQRPIERGDRVAHERVTLMASSEEGAFAREFRGIPGRGGLRGRLVDGLNAFRPGRDPNPALSRSLLALADQMESRGTDPTAEGAS
jgi:exosortase/archaeosortase family protein